MKKITILLATLLLAVSQSAYSQTSLDTLQIELATELKQIVDEQRKLRSQEDQIRTQRLYLQKQETALYNGSLTTPNNSSPQMEQILIDRERMGAWVRTQQTALDKQEHEIRFRQLALQRQENEIKRQQEALQRQQQRQRVETARSTQ